MANIDGSIMTIGLLLVLTFGFVMDGYAVFLRVAGARGLGEVLAMANLVQYIARISNVLVIFVISFAFETGRLSSDVALIFLLASALGLVFTFRPGSLPRILQPCNECPSSGSSSLIPLDRQELCLATGGLPQGEIIQTRFCFCLYQRPDHFRNVRPVRNSVTLSRHENDLRLFWPVDQFFRHFGRLFGPGPDIHAPSGRRGVRRRGVIPDLWASDFLCGRDSGLCLDSGAMNLIIRSVLFDPGLSDLGNILSLGGESVSGLRQLPCHRRERRVLF